VATLEGDRGLTPEDAERVLLAGQQPTGRPIAPEHVADLMVYLCRPEAADISGAVLPIDGAWSAS
jgi:3-hydroxybutyrate dehydrogenase